MAKHVKKYLIVLLSVIVVNVPVVSVEAATNSQKIQRITDQQFIGTLAIYRNGKLAEHVSEGYANEPKRIKNQLNTMYEIDSIQKLITGVLIMQQVEKHHLKLTDTLDRYFPSAKGGSHITIRQMLNMTSGLSMKESDMFNFLTDDNGIIRHDISVMTYNQANQGKWDYQPVNFVLLAGILEKVFHQTYHHLVHQQIIQRFKLKHTKFAYELPNSWNKTIGYQVPKNATGISYGQPYARSKALERDELGTGQLYMSVGDLYHVVHGIMRGKVIKKKNVPILYSKGSLSGYGGGLYNRPGRYKSNGAGYGFESTIRISKDGQDAVIILSNYEFPKMSISTLGDKIDREILK